MVATTVGRLLVSATPFYAPHELSTRQVSTTSRAGSVGTGHACGKQRRWQSVSNQLTCINAYRPTEQAVCMGTQRLISSTCSETGSERAHVAKHAALLEKYMIS